MNAQQIIENHFLTWANQSAAEGFIAWAWDSLDQDPLSLADEVPYSVAQGEARPEVSEDDARAWIQANLEDINTLRLQALAER